MQGIYRHGGGMKKLGQLIEMKKVKFREWQKAKASPEEEVKLKEYVEAR